MIPTHLTSTTVPTVPKGHPITTLTAGNAGKGEKNVQQEITDSYNQFHISQSSMSSYMFNNSSYSQGSENIQSVLASVAASSQQHPSSYSASSQYTAPPGPPPATGTYAYSTFTQQQYTAPSYPPPPATGQYYDYSQFPYQPPPNVPPPSQYAPLGYNQMTYQQAPPLQNPPAPVGNQPAANHQLDQKKHKSRVEKHSFIKRLT